MDYLLVQFVTAHEKIIHETVTNETLVIDLGAGTYYSFNEIASHIWQHLIAGSTLQSLETTLSESFPDNASKVQTDLVTFAESLLEAGLLIVSPEPVTKQPLQELTITSYKAPAFGIHRDMEALLLADPIHEFQDS